MGFMESVQKEEDEKGKLRKKNEFDIIESCSLQYIKSTFLLVDFYFY